MAGKLDINQADQDAIDAVEGLSGHGPEIVRYRRERGGFTAIAQLEEVPGLTGKLPADLDARVTVGERC